MRTLWMPSAAIEVNPMILTYNELIQIPTFEERFRYLKLSGTVGKDIYGSKRRLNQGFYHSAEWLRFRDRIIFRDKGCDLAAEGFEIFEPIIIHHLNPISYEDILSGASCVLDPNNVVCTKHSTHNAIHYGSETHEPDIPIERRKNDTCPWRH